MAKDVSGTIQSGTRPNTALPAAVLFILLCAGCATQSFAPPAADSYAFISRGITQTVGEVRVTAAVPSREETRQIFQADLYELGIQPVWLKAENGHDANRVRVALRSIDADYYSPYEVAWMLRSEFADSGEEAFGRWLYENRLLRRVPPGESRSGFVFTHPAAGTKGFNVDLFSNERSYNFTFFVPMPGFEPDYINVDFASLYSADEITNVAFEYSRAAFENLPCCSTDQSGTAQGDPINIAIVGSGDAMRRTLLRAHWNETASGSEDGALARTHYLLGRPPDGTFHLRREKGGEGKELRLWLAPLQVDGLPVWIGQVSQELSDLRALLPFAERRIDPDLDAVRWFVAQDFWYSQSLKQVGITTGVPPSTLKTPAKNFHGHKYFTDGLRAILFISEEPVAMDETKILNWEIPGAAAR